MNKTLYQSHSIFTGYADQPLVDGYLVVEDGWIKKIETGLPSPAEKQTCDTQYDFGNQILMPGFIDAHTHLIFGGNRSNELALKLSGATYMELHKEGGIKATMRATRQASFHELKEKAQSALDQMLCFGVTTVEAKSGYGLDKETEIRSLEVIRQLNAEHIIDLIPTYLGAHDVPPEFSSAEAYANFIIDTMLPLIREQKLAEYCDIFCEKGIFELKTTERIARAALSHGFKLKVHADEIEALGGSGLAGDLGATSAEHLMVITEADMDKMSKSGTVAVLLPATTLYLHEKQYAPARTMLEKGIPVALATDYNPGSCPCLNLQVPMTLGCLAMRLKPEEVFQAVTVNAAKAINRESTLGSLEVGKQADFCVLDVSTPAEFFYHFGVNHVREVFKKGKQVVSAGRILS